METLDQFILRRQSTKELPSNAFVREAGFSELYVRFGPRYFDREKVEGVLDIARVQATRPGSGAFSDLVKILHERAIPLYIECVHNRSFADKLLRMGFSRIHDNSFYLMPDHVLK